MFRALKRLFIWLGLMAEKATETDSINEAVIERGIRDAKSKAGSANTANGQLAGQISMLRQQVKRLASQKAETEGMLAAAANANDDANGANYADQLALIESEYNENKGQLDQLEELYKQNLEVIANSIREVQKFEREFEQVKVRARIGSSMRSLSTLVSSSITELQGMTGGELAQSMQQLRTSAAGGEGQMRATLDLAKAMGSDVQRKQEAKAQRGKLLFEEFKRKQGLSQASGNSAPVGTNTERQKVAE